MKLFLKHELWQISFNLHFVIYSIKTFDLYPIQGVWDFKILLMSSCLLSSFLPILRQSFSYKI